jgi:membrane protein
MPDAPAVKRPAREQTPIQLPEWVPQWLAVVIELPILRFIVRLAQSASSDDVFGLAAAMAYRFLFALFPFLIFLAAFVGFIGARVGSADLFENVMRLMALLFPRDVQRVLEDWVRGVLSTQSPGLLTAGAAGALWGAAGGVGTLIRGLNRAYGVKENRPYWLAQILALMTTVVLAILMLGGVGLYTIGGVLMSWAIENVGVDEGIWFWWNLVRGPGVTLGLGIVLAVLYAVLPNMHLRVRHTWPGAVFATLAWLGLTTGFGFYVSNLGSYDRTFGSLGAAVVLMVWMYAVGVILLLGGEINALVSGIKEAAPPDSDAYD